MVVMQSWAMCMHLAPRRQCEPANPKSIAMIPHIALCLLLLSYAPAAFSQDCVLVTCGQDEYCEVAPSGLTASLPTGLAIKSIRGNTKVASRGDAALLDCRPVSRLPTTVSADESSIYGSLRITGTLRMVGVLRFEPNDGGELEFRPEQGAHPGAGKFFTANFARIKLDQVQPQVRITLPASLAEADCWQARATAELSDFSLLIGDTSAAGTYAQRARITRITSFTRCT